MIQLWGRANSINVQKVMWILEELGLQFERFDAGGDFGGLSEPDFLAMNPNGLVPVLKDAEACVWESNSIIRYLANKYDANVLFPVGPSNRANCEKWMDWNLSTLQPNVMGLFWGYYRTPATLRNEERNKELLHLSLDKLAILDRQLAESAFVAGDDFTIADIPCGTLLYRFFGMGLTYPEMPNVQAWYSHLRQRAGYSKYVMQPFDGLYGRQRF